MKKIQGKTTVSLCINETSILQETVKLFDKEYKMRWTIVNAQRTLTPLIL